MEKGKTVILSSARTPFGSFMGKLSKLSASYLGSYAIKDIINRSQIDISNIDEVIMGNVLSAGIGQAPARQAAIFGGLDKSVNCMTISKVCGSGRKAIMLADQSIKSNQSKAVIAGGMESMSNTPHYLINSRIGTKLGNIKQIDGMVHVSDLSWNEPDCANILANYNKGNKISVKILDIDVKKERISLSVKHLVNDPIQEFIEKNPLKTIVSGRIKSIDDKGLTISLTENILGFIKKSNLAKDKLEQKIDRFAIDELIDSMIISHDQKARKINLSIKDMEIIEEKKVLSKYGSSDSGALLGDILSNALDNKKSE